MMPAVIPTASNALTIDTMMTLRLIFLLPPCLMAEAFPAFPPSTCAPCT
jgi:hypothetical protein